MYDCDIISSCLQRFVSKARRVDSTSYPPKTLYQILCGLLRHSKEHQRDPPNFLDRKDMRFKKLHGTCDVIFRSLHQAVIGAKINSAQVISDEEEEKLWETGVLNTNTPNGLQKAVFYHVGKACCLRGGEEQRNLKASQFTRQYNPDRYIYTENGSKNRSGGFYQFHLDNKSVLISKNADAGDRCLVSMLDLYLSKLPPAAKAKDIFYCKPLKKFNKESYRTPSSQEVSIFFQVW